MRFLYSPLIFASILLTSVTWFEGKTQECFPLDNYEQLANMPEPVANNAVCGGFVAGQPYLYSFGGIDSTKTSSGIHLRSWRLKLTDGESNWEAIPDLPDTLGKVASSATYLDGIIYIVGGYHVFSNGSEASSIKVHRFDCQSNSYLSDAADLPVAIDDHVSAVWRDSLLYVVTGWSNSGNVSSMQVYDPSMNEWSNDFQLWNNGIYNSFGASGTIIGDTIYYLGGAQMGTNFPIQDYLRIGVISANDPMDVTWSDTLLPGQGLYRAACIPLIEPAVSFKAPVWIGGSRVTYNYDGIAYNGTGGVEPASVIQFWDDEEMSAFQCMQTVMDLRGAFVDFSTVYTAGGMDSNQVVTNKTYKYSMTIPGLSEQEVDLDVHIFPNPASNVIHIESNSLIERVTLFDMMGRKQADLNQKAGTSEYLIPSVPASMYVAVVHTADGIYFHRMIIDQ